MSAPERIIRQSLDTAEVLRSPDLVGCHGLRPVPQTKDYTCGAAAVATVLRYLGKVSNEYQCIEAMRPSPVVGIAWWPIVQYLRHREVKAVAWCHYSVEQLIDNARDKRPTLVEWLDWGGHWVVHVGYSKAYNALVFADPAKPRSNFTCHTVQEFERYWVAGGTGSMERTKGLAIAIPAPGVGRKGDFSYARGTRPRRVLMDWRTKKAYNGNIEHALA